MQFEIPATLQPALGSGYPKCPRILYILRRCEGVSSADFAAALASWRKARPYQVEAGAILARAGVQIEEAQIALTGRFSRPGVEFNAIDGYVSLDLEEFAPTAADFETLFQAADGCLDTLDAVVDRSRSTALAGVANLVIPGNGPSSMILLLDRLPSLSLLQYNEWWIQHGHDHRRWHLSQIGYHQLHTDPALNARAAKIAGTPVAEQCITDIMYLAHLEDAFGSVIDRKSEEAKALNADIGAHVSMAKISGSLFKEV